jgi:hypothetical protein
MLTLFDVAPTSSIDGYQEGSGSTLSPFSSSWPYLITILLLVLVIAVLAYFLIKSKKKS